MKKLILLLSVLSMTAATPALATEGPVYGGPIGGTDIRNAYLPPFPGFYGAIADVPGDATEVAGNNGGSNPNLKHVNVVFNIVAAALEYVYPVRIFGGSVATAVQESYYPYLRFSVNNNTQDISDWGDTYADILKWSRFYGHLRSPAPTRPPLPYGLSVLAAYSMIFPTGSFNTHQYTTGGHNDYYIIPNMALTYLTAPNRFGDGVEFSGHVFYDHSLINPLDHYKNGDLIDLDYAVTERSGRWQWGAAGFVATQLGRDTVEGVTVPLHGRYFGLAQLGPIVSYDFPRLGMSLKAKVGIPFWVRNTLDGPICAIVLSARL